MAGLPIILGGVLGSAVAMRLLGALRHRDVQEAALKEYRTLLVVSHEKLVAIKDAMAKQMELGLAGAPDGLMMLPSFVDVLPSGHEQGEFFAADLGGTNLRVTWVSLGPERGQVLDQEVQEWSIPGECYDTDNGRLLDWVAEKSLQVMGRHPPQPESPSPPVLGFCFSFACKQTSLSDGRLLLWTKSFRGSGLVGKDVVAALTAAFAARGATVRIPALMNDTVATLVALRYSQPATRAGIILGTGTNCAYLEKTERFRTLPPREASQPRLGAEMVVNTEWGDMGAAGDAAGVLPRCNEDLWVDCASANPGHGLFEKLIAGLYMGEVARRVMLRMAERGGLFGGVSDHGIGTRLASEGTFGSAALCAVDEDDSEGLEGAIDTLTCAFGLRWVSKRDATAAREVCRLVAARSARLCAAAIAAVVERCVGGAGEPVVIAVDGSVFTKYSAFRRRIRESLEELLGEEAAAGVKLELVEGGSVAGAAFLAAAAASRSSES